MMIMRIKSSLFISLCLILLTMSITAQDKQLSLHDLIPGGKTYSRFVPRDLKQLRWCGDEYLYVKGDSVLGAKPGKKEEVLFTLERLNGALTAANLQTVGCLAFWYPMKVVRSWLLLANSTGFIMTIRRIR